MENTAAISPKATSTLVSGRSSTPDMNRIPKAMQLRTIAVPMSGCLMMSAPDTTSTPMTGAMTCLAGADRSVRFTTMSAANRHSASFISSDGWSRRRPTPIHRDEPPAVTPRPGTRTANSSTTVTATSGTAQRRQTR